MPTRRSPATRPSAPPPDDTAVPVPPEHSDEEPAMAPIITNTGDDGGSAPTG